MELMQYFTLDGRYTTLYGHHFVMLNHFQHGKLISFPFYLLLSLEEGIANFKKNPRNPFFHEDLMLIIVDFIKANCIGEAPRPPELKRKNKGSKKFLDEEVVKSEGMEIEEFEAWLDGYHTDFNYIPSSGGKKPSSSKEKPSILHVKRKSKEVCGEFDEGTCSGKKAKS